MSLISATDLAKSYGTEDIFTNVSASIPHQARIALVGPNGVGKTTLLRLLIGDERPDRGFVQRARNVRIGFLPQEAVDVLQAGAGSQALWELCLEAFGELRAQEAELAHLEAAMGDPHQAEQAMARYGPLQEAFERAGGYTYPSRARQVLNGLGFTADEYARPLRRLSGGERTRAHLASLLLQDPDLLVLDEPTNHLDIQAMEWLESWLRDWPGAALLVSHDRYFLDRVADTVWELSPASLEVYRGNYTAYVHQREARLSHQLDRHRAQQEHVRREQEYIRRNIAGQNTRQARGRRKRLERFLQDEAVDRPHESRAVHIDFGQAQRSGNLVLETDGLAIGFSDSARPLFRIPDLTLLRGECAALVGPNGAGKTTFLRTLLAEIEPYEGRVRLGAGLRMGYFAQAHASLDPERTILEEVLAASPDLKPGEARALLGQYLFSGETVFKKVAVLSGGERGRLALVKLVLEGANLLLLDEPTTHLDLPSQEILEQALAAFPGTILLVSHDRYLIDALATQIWAVSPQEQALTAIEGGYAEYEQAQRAVESRRAAVRREPRARSPDTRKASAAEIEATETRIAELEGVLQELATGIEHAGADIGRVRDLGLRFAEIEREMQDWLTRWESLVDQPRGA
jgi:ATP-binding cassette subfamily F protein 3